MRLQIDLPSTAKMAALLKEAKAAHAAFEKKLGRPHPEWEDWYAEYIVKRLLGFPAVPSA